MSGYQAKSNNDNNKKSNNNDKNSKDNASSLKDNIQRKGASMALQAMGVPKPLADVGANMAQKNNLGKKTNPAQLAKQHQSKKKNESEKNDNESDKSKNQSNSNSKLKNAKNAVNNFKNAQDEGNTIKIAISFVKMMIAVGPVVIILLPFLIILLVLVSVQSIFSDVNDVDNMNKLNPISASIGGGTPTSTDGIQGQFYAPIQKSGVTMYGADSNNSGFNHDISAETGTEVYAAADGTATFYSVHNSNGKLVSYGNYIILTTSDNYEFRYGHLSELSGYSLKYGAGSTYPSSCNDCPKYEYGSRTVKKGEVIGKVGESGNASGAHLHFEIRKDGTRVAPESYVGY
ncbi:MAG: M23 family metallopeptidase [Bacilli bacterium]